MIDDLIAALALVFVLEGLMPVLAPKRWRIMLLKFCMLPTAYIRGLGLLLLCVGALLLSMIA